jgi:hypothetical protein
MIVLFENVYLYGRMKVAGHILMVILVFLTVQPVFAKAIVVEQKSDCCMQDKKSTNKNNTCDQTACNPLRVCVYGSFFVVDNAATDIIVPSPIVQKITPANDNRISSALSECWHPPRLCV